MVTSDSKQARPGKSVRETSSYTNALCILAMPNVESIELRKFEGEDVPDTVMDVGFTGEWEPFRSLDAVIASGMATGEHNIIPRDHPAIGHYLYLML